MSLSQEMDGASRGTPNTPSRSHFYPMRQHSARQGSRINDVTPVNHRAIPSATTVGQLPMPGHDRRMQQSSATWTCSSGDPATFSDTDDIQDRPEFVQEYNRLAKKHGIRLLAPEPLGPCCDCGPLPADANIICHHTHPHGDASLHRGRRGWFSRTFLRQVSGASNASSIKLDKKVRHKRSVSDMAMHIVSQTKRDSLKDEDLQSLVRLCGKSILYLPSEYAPGSLVLPTCLRATAQYLVQHATETRGVFRIPGSVRIVNALYDYYCAEGDADEIASTIRCPNLPSHIKAGTHDVASAFKRLLSGLPGGILGSLQLFDAFVAIHSQLQGNAEFTKTKQTKLRARLIALAVSSVRSHFRRELICAVFGLLCLIGRTAETTAREDEHGRPLPTGDLMGYNALGIVFGPLLIGDLLSAYTMTHATPSAGILLYPVTLLHARKERRRSKTMEETESRIPTVDKIHVANAIAEMLITHWREVVKHIRSLGVLRVNKEEVGEGDERPRNSGLRPSASESFVMKRPAEWSKQRPISAPYDLSQSPVPPSPTPEARRTSSRGHLPENNRTSLTVQRLRPKGARSLSSGHTCTKAPLAVLSPTVEEPASGGLASRSRRDSNNRRGHSPASTTVRFSTPVGDLRSRTDALVQRPEEFSPSRSSPTERPTSMNGSPINPHCKITAPTEGDISERNSVPSSSRSQGLRSSADSFVLGDDPDRLHIPHRAAGPRDPSHRSESSPRIALVETVLASPRIVTRKQPSERSCASAASNSQDGLSRNSASMLRKSMDSSRASQEENIPPQSLQTPCADISQQQEDDSPSPIAVRQIRLRQQGPHTGGPGLRRTKLGVPRSRHVPRGSGSPGPPSSPSERHSQHEDDAPTDFEHTGPPEPSSSMRANGENEKGAPRLRILDVRKQVVLEPKSNSTIPMDSYFQAHPEGLEKIVPACTAEDEELQKKEAKLGNPSSPLPASHDHDEDAENTASNNHPNVQDSFDNPRLNPALPSTPVSEARPRSQKSIGSGVKAMAARFEGVSNEPSQTPASAQSPIKTSGVRPVRPQYTVNPSPTRSSKSPSKPEFNRLSRSDSVHSGRPPWIAAMHGRGQRLSVGETHLHASVPGSSQSKILGEHCVNSSQGAMAQGNDGAYDTDPVSASGQGGSEETIADVGRVVTVEYQPVSRIGLHQDELTASSTSHPHQGRNGALEVQQPGFRDYACMPRLPPRTSLRLPPHAVHDDAALPAPKMVDELAASSNTNHLAVTEAFGSEDADVSIGQTIASLQQQLQDKTDEVDQLRSLLESCNDTDIAMLREQLRLVGRECLLWRTRAEVAEKRVATFKRLAARVKALRAGEATTNIPGPAHHPAAGMDEADDEADIQDEGMRRVEQWLEQDRRMDSSGEHTEDGAVVAARIRESLRAMEDEQTETATTVPGDVAESHYDREDEGSMTSQHAATITRAKRPPPQGLCRHRYGSSASDGEGISAAVASMWVAAEGRL